MENKTSKYFKYAVGEIVLVMIGILLALQVNNWNEDRKDKAFEIKMLTEIRNALRFDLKNFENMISRLDKLDSATNFMAKQIYKQSIFKDSLFNRGDSRWYYLRAGVQYQYNRGPYEGIKSSGIDKISNDSLRNALIKLYDFDFPRNEEITKWYDHDYEQHNDILSSFLNETKVVFKDDEYNFEREFPDDLLRNKEFITLVGNISRRGKSVSKSINVMINKIEPI
ncbi:DUF6090 family protein, partial [Aegicerativicinus sediminis]